jgi:NAD(P)-dependent dehydrogenase (short-subunit alcohol dehydrogenase family)
MSDVDVLGLDGKAALVIGGASGIGRATSLLLGRCGANVVVGDLDAARADVVAKEVAALGVTAVGAGGDATVEAEATALVQGAAAALGGDLDVVINIVGIAGWARLLEMDMEFWDLDLRRNLIHHLHVGRAFARSKTDTGTPGAMALVASVSGLYGAPNHGAYGAAKAGVMSLVRTMAQEWAPLGIRVNAVAPDAIRTPRVAASLDARGVTDTESAGGRPLARMGTVEEIAGPLVFLCSDLASYMTGQTLVVDGGEIIAHPSRLSSM